jgi:hypothetical protein
MLDGTPSFDVVKCHLQIPVSSSTKGKYMKVTSNFQIDYMICFFPKTLEYKDF